MKYSHHTRSSRLRMSRGPERMEPNSTSAMPKMLRLCVALGGGGMFVQTNLAKWSSDSEILRRRSMNCAAELVNKGRPSDDANQKSTESPWLKTFGHKPEPKQCNCVEIS